MKRGDAIKQLGPVLAHERLQRIHTHAFFIRRHTHELCAVKVQRLQHAKESWRLHKHRVAPVHKNAAQQVKSLHGAGERQDLLFRHMHAFGRKNVLSNGAPQRRIPLCGPILQQVCPIPREERIHNRADLLRGERFGGRIPTAKGYDIAFCEQLEHSADGAACDPLHAGCKFRHCAFPPSAGLKKPLCFDCKHRGSAIPIYNNVSRHYR